jgi:acyl-CoA dehydrogenase
VGVKLSEITKIEHCSFYRLIAITVIDHAQQAFGAMGVTQELPLSWLAQKVRTMRDYEGPSEVHRMVIARRLLGGR